MLTTAWLAVDRVLHGANENTSDFVLEQDFKRHPTTKFNKTPSANISFCK